MLKNTKHQEKSKWGLLSAILAFLTSIGGLIPLTEIFRNPSETASQIVLGLSASRVLLVGVILIIMVVNVFLGFLMLKRDAKLRGVLITKINAHKNIIIDGLLIGALGLSWLAFIGNHNFGSNQAYYQNLKPLLSYLASIDLAWLFLGILNNFQAKTILDGKKIGFRRFIGPAIIFGSFIIIWAFIYFTGIGVTPKYPYWGNSGTILFGYQVIFALLLVASVAIGIKVIKPGTRVILSSKWLDVGIFILLWGVAALVWIQAEPNHNFFAPTSRNQIYYPYSDAARYDTAAQSILIGEGFGNQSYTNRPLYITFLALVHVFSNQDYLIFIAIQAGLLAIAIPYLYLIGKRLHGRFLGFLVALLGIILEFNAITSPTTIRVSHTKLIMTEYPTAVLLIISAYYAIAWFQEVNKRNRLFVIVLGLLTLSMLIRMHTFVILLGLIFLFFVCAQTKNSLQILKNLLITGVFIFLLLSPWMLRNYIVVGRFSVDPGRFNLLMENRWQIDPLDSDLGLGQSYKPSGGLLFVRPANSSGKDFSFFTSEISDYIVESAAHFLHNEVISVLALPSSYHVFPSQEYYQSDYYLFENWSGYLTPDAKIYLLVNLVVLSVGITAAYQRNKYAGLIPLVFQVLYVSSDALVRTSGWRYIKPIEWVTLFYFAFGVVELLLALRNFFQNEERKKIHSIKDQIAPNFHLKLADIFRYGFVFLFLSILVAFSPIVIPQRYTPSVVDENLVLSEKLIQEKTQFSLEDVHDFLSSPDAVISVGRMLYPRFLRSDESIHHKPALPFFNLGLNRFEFILLNQNATPVFFPTSITQTKLDQAADVIVVGCKGNKNGASFVEAALIIVSDDEDYDVYYQEGMEELICPVSSPEIGN